MEFLAEISLDAEDIFTCRTFAKNSVETHLDEYKKRGQDNLKAIRHQIQTGKMAELGVQRFLEENASFKKLYPVDFEIYSKNKKSFEPDIKIITKDGSYWKLHIKSITQDSANNYGVSWLFQKKDPLIMRPDENDLLVLCLVDGATIKIIDIRDAQKIKYDQPKKKILQKTKVALYL